ncbi:protein mono-ADP-ribosyltransferase PARP14-like isoform X2 [Engystomops pustulosus]
MVLEGQLIYFTIEEEDQACMQSTEMSGDVTSRMESITSSENTGETNEIQSFVPLDSDFQFEVVKDEIDALCQSFQSLKVSCENRELILSCNTSEVIKSARDEIKNLISSVEVRTIEFSKVQADFLSSKESKYISDKLFGDLPEGKVILDIPRGFRLYALSTNLLDQAEAVLKNHLLHVSIKIKADEKEIVSSEPWKELLDKLMCKKDIKICFHDNNDDLIVSIVGFTEEVKKAKKECEDFLYQRKTVKEKLFLEDPILIENIDDLLKWFNLGEIPANVQISKATGQTVTLVGPRVEVEKTTFVLQKLKKKNVDILCINKYGATHYFNNQGKTLLDDTQKKFGCRVYLCDTENKAEGIQKADELGAKDGKDSNKKEVRKHASDNKETHKDGTSSSSQKEKNLVETQRPVLQLMLSFGNLENKKAKAMVASLLSTKPDLEAMNVTKGIKNKAGNKFSHLFSAVFGCQSSLQSGQHFPMEITGKSYSLDCDYVIFISCQTWNGPDGSSCKALKKGLSETLEYCQTKNLQSVAMSVIGPGKMLQYPPEAAARIIGEVVQSFVQRVPNTCVKKIELVIPTENESLYYVCRETLLEMNLDDRIRLCNEDGVIFHKISFGESSEVKIGNLSLALTYNDITKESTEAIVNSTNFSNWNKNTVAHAIFTAAGQHIIGAAQQGASREKVVMTVAGNLKCKYIMHCNCKQDIANISVLVKEIIIKCESVGLRSVAIPAIGTGECQFNAKTVAHDMIDSISTLSRTRNLTSLTAVRLVTFRPSIYYIFYSELKKLSRPVQDSSWNPLELLTLRLKDPWIPDNDAIKDLPTLQQPLQPPTTKLVIVTDQKAKVNEIKSFLERGFQNEVKYRKEQIEQPLLKTFSLEEIEMLFSVLNDQIEVGMILDRLKNYIFIEGSEKDVVDVTMNVHTNLSAIMTARLEMATKERAGLLVQWGYSDGKTSKPFTINVSQLLEDNYQARKSNVTINLENGEKTLVDLRAMKAVIEATKQKLTVIRRDLEAETQCPLHWDNMNGLLLKIVEVDPNSEEYETVKCNFNKTVNLPIKKIERIQNRYQHIAYMLRKHYITEKNGPCHVNEKNLFHGTAPQSCHSINYSGFSRSFAGQHAAAFGNGVYFAENASYSANQTYSPKDPNTGERFIYQAKVLVGRHTKGQSGMRHPPSRTQNDPFDYYDSLTDTIINPTMFVVFHDDQVYPEYLITFT